MLIMTLKKNEKVLIGEEISIKVLEIRGSQVRVGFQAPADLLVLREKLAIKGEA
jgi:carbon storage regulator